MSRVPVIDLFAGCGGLSEGFEVFKAEDRRPFRLELAVDMDRAARDSMKLRCFFSSFFSPDRVPQKYYDFVQGKCTLEELYQTFPKQAEAADARCLLWELGGEGEEYSEKILDKKIKSAIRGAKNWVLLGGPPCQAYSLIARPRNKTVKGYDPATDKRNFLYEEYLKVLERHQPAVFVMENVRGVHSSSVEKEGRSIWAAMITDLHDPDQALNGDSSANRSYYPYKLYSLVSPVHSHDIFGEPVLDAAQYLVKCEQHGIPQARHRVIILGVRSDIEKEPDRLRYRDPITAGHVLKGLPRLRSGVTGRGREDSTQEWVRILLKSRQQEWWSEAKKKVPEVVDEMEKVLRSIDSAELDRGGNFVSTQAETDYRPDWFLDKRLTGACNHQARAHMETDLYRYLFVSCHTKIKEAPVRLNDFPDKLLPDHESAKKGNGNQNFADRFGAVARSRPSKTVMSHIGKDGHYYIHYDAEQCRSLTVREAARLQTFPDNYYFCGTRTQQYQQIGNAVPPLLAFQIAEIVAGLEIDNG